MAFYVCALIYAILLCYASYKVYDKERYIYN